MTTRVVLIGYGPVGARFVEGMLPAIRAGRATLSVFGAEQHDVYNRVLLAEYAVGRASRERLEISDSDEARDAGVVISLDSVVVSVDRSRQSVRLGTGEDVQYDRLVFATGARANIPTLTGLERSRRDRASIPATGDRLDTGAIPMPSGIVALRDLHDAEIVRSSVEAGHRIIVLGAGVLGMEFALAASEQGASVAAVYHGDVPMERNLDNGGGRILAAAARQAGVTMSSHSRAESVLLSTEIGGGSRFDALICADGKQLDADLLVLSCGVGARTELAHLSGLRVSSGILVDEELRSWTDPDIYAIGDCAQVAARPAGDDSSSRISGAPTGLIGPGWRQADWLAARLAAELEASDRPELLPAERRPVVMLKSEGVNVCSGGETSPDVWTDDAELEVSQWADPGRGTYVKIVTRAQALVGFVCAGMPRAAAELTLLFERGSEVPEDRSALLRLDGAGSAGAQLGVPSLDDTVCACNGVSGRAITEAVSCGSTTVALVGKATRAGTGCGGCRDRIRELIEAAPLQPAAL
jgi:assimilatory nitrate reductase electron transfer subunit